MKVAITGGSGLLGRHFINYLHKCSHYTPIIISRRNCEDLYKTEVRVTDYSIKSLTDSLVDIDAVVHLAAHRGNSNSIQDYQDNFLITQNLYESISINKIKNIVFASTIAVYSQDELLPWTELSLPEPISAYGISKLSGEYLGHIYAKQFKLQIKNLRFPPVFGFNSEENLKDRMINKFIMQAWEKEQLLLFSNPLVKREFLYVADAAKALFLAIDAEFLTGTYNTGSGETYTNLEIAQIINKAFENEGNIVVEDRKEIAIQSSFMNSSKAKNELGFEASYSLFNAMQEIYKEMRNVYKVF
jgi:UDP-glucose 4-epimerase